MAKSWKPKLPKAYQPYKPPKPFDPFKLPKEKKEIQPHIITLYEKELIRILTPAIENKKLIKFWYEDTTTDFKDWRIVEPHLIGQTKYKTANVILSAWFLPTPIQRMQGHEPDWKTYILDNVKKLQILAETYPATRPGYNPNDKTMIKIFCRTLKRGV
jgi:hypothetical protein